MNECQHITKPVAAMRGINERQPSPYRLTPVDKKTASNNSRTDGNRPNVQTQGPQP